VSATDSGQRRRQAGLAAALVSVPFLPALTEAFRLTQANGLQNYAPVVPLIATYLGWRGGAEPASEGIGRAKAARRGDAGSESPPDHPRPPPDQGALPTVSENAAPIGGEVALRPNRRRLFFLAPSISAAALLGARLAEDPALAAALRVVAWVALLGGALAVTLGREDFTRWKLPLLLLLFIAPLPHAFVSACEAALQHGSAACARFLLELHGTPVHLDRLTLHLRGMSLWVAPECSGLRSSLVLLLLTVVAAGALLHTPLARLGLVIAVAPIAIARNGLRIFVIGELCAQDGPAALESLLHRQGGPVFFALSLLPWTLLLLALCRREATARRPVPVYQRT
jgi:exosortase